MQCLPQMGATTKSSNFRTPAQQLLMRALLDDAARIEQRSDGPGDGRN
jgi:hypothetical protein